MYPPSGLLVTLPLILPTLVSLICCSPASTVFLILQGGQSNYVATQVIFSIPMDFLPVFWNPPTGLLKVPSTKTTQNIEIKYMLYIEYMEYENACQSCHGQETFKQRLRQSYFGPRIVVKSRLKNYRFDTPYLTRGIIRDQGTVFLLL